MSQYVSSLAMRQSRTTMRRNQNTIRFNGSSAEKTLGPISNTILLAVIISFMGLLYLTQITKTSSFGYTVDNLQKEKSALIEEQQSLEVEAARLQALERIENSEVAKSLTTPENVEFVQ